MGNPVVKVGKVFTIPEGGGISPLAEASEGSGGTAPGGVEFVIREPGTETYLRLDKGNASFSMWAEYLGARSQSGTPVYVEADDETNEVLRVLPSYMYTVEAVREAAGGVSVCFLQSPAVSLLRASHLHFAELRELLSGAAAARATLLVTVKPEDRELIDARPVPEGPPSPEVSNGPAAVLDTPPFEDTPPVVPGPLTAAHFQQQLTLSETLFAFDFVASIPELTIPFKYPVDCCVARAHMMSRFLQERFGISVRKLWNYGSAFPDGASIRFNTANHPSGSVPWRYHVAPVVSVSNFQAQFLVLDPSMFTVRPVTIQEWLAAQNDPGATQSHSDGSAFTLVPAGDVTFDDLLRSTNDQLDGHRLAWRSLRATFFNPPPA